MGLDIIFIVLGVLIFIFGFMIFLGGFRSDSQPIESELQFKDGIPILPRHQRELQDDLEMAQSLEPDTTKSTPSVDALSNLATVAQRQADKQAQATDAQVEQAPTVVQSPTPAQDSPSLEVELEPTINLAPQEKQAELTPPKAGDTAPKVLADPDKIPPIEAYFDEEEWRDLRNNDVLHNYSKTVTIVVMPKNNFVGVDGKTILKIARQYALKFGELNLFHRYEDPKGAGMLWFSMLGVTVDGVAPFDLVSLPETNYRGLAFFLPLPHPQALRGFDGMLQIAYSVADELEADAYDENGNLLDNERLQALRQMVSEYKG